VFEAWRAAFPMRAGQALTDTRRRAIEGALRRDGVTVETILLAIAGVARSHFHATSIHNDLDLICREGKIDSYVLWGQGAVDPNANSSGGPSSSRPSRVADVQPKDPGPFVTPWQTAPELTPEQIAAELAAHGPA
jgi:hypothetical protein